MTHDLLAHAMPGAPPEIWWLAPAVILLLGAAASVDAFRGRVPDEIVFAALFVTVAAQGFAEGWPFAAWQLAIGLGAGCALYALNFLWYRLFKRDALGMGDAKWTMAAISCFGLYAGLIAWGMGAALGLVYMGARLLCARLRGHNRDCAGVQIHFAPFLFAGLLAGIWWLRLR